MCEQCLGKQGIMKAQKKCISLVLVLYVAMVIISVHVCTVSSNEWQGDLSVYELASFSNPDVEIPGFDERESEFNHFALSDHGNVYVGGANWLYRLDGDLQLVQNVTTCIEPSEGDETGVPCRQTSNYNKILVVDSQQSRLITCGSEYDGTCQLRNLQDISDKPITPDLSIAGFGKATTVSLIAPGIEQQEWLYVAVTYNDNFISTSAFAPITRRRRYAVLLAPALSARADDSINFSNDARIPKFLISYVGVFSYRGFTYFLAFQEEDINIHTFVSKINRVCQNGPNLDAYTEITIECNGAESGVFSLVQAAHMGPAGPDLAASLGLDADDMVMYAVFANGTSDVPRNHSALCVFKMTDVLNAFKTAVTDCIQKGEVQTDSFECLSMYCTKYLEGSFCRKFPTVNPSNSHLCHPVADGRTRLYKYAKGVNPLRSTALLELQGTLVSSVITSIEVNHTVALIGTSSGDLLKVHIESNTTARLYERVPLGGGPVLSDVKIDHETREVHVLTEQKLIKMRVENCGQYTSCETCIGTEAGTDGDPYCGWCTLERRCTRYSECSMADVSTRWLAYNAAQCIKIKSVAPCDSLPITVTEQQITLTVQELPDLLPGKSYECHFGSHQSPATKDREVLRCTSPPSAGIPAIQPGSKLIINDAVTVSLSVYSNETSVEFIDTDFHFYECSTHTSCVSCVGSDWACDWCVFENRCTHDNSTCTGANEIIITGANNTYDSTLKGPEFCPQLQMQAKDVLLPNGIGRTITIKTENLPNATQISNYQCRLNIEGVPQAVTAVRSEDSIICTEQAYTYAAEEPESSVPVTVEWTDGMNSGVHILDDVHGFEVTLYKCAVQGLDCSRCVTARRELNCVFCESTCKLNETCTSSEDSWVTLNNGKNCPDPVLASVYPVSGPIEGNTVLTVMGTDIGRRFGDVTSVMVGDQPCSLTGLGSDYLIGASVSCRTPPNTEAKQPVTVTLTVTGADNTTQHSSGSVSFEYKDPKITDFSPLLGPEAGGTAVSVTGTALNTGRDIKAFIGDFNCSITTPLTDTVAVCESGESMLDYKGLLSMSFDGALRTSTQMYTYTHNSVILDISPLTSIYSGGRELTVFGNYLDVCQKRQIVVRVGNEQFKEDCVGVDSIEMQCPSPDVSSLFSSTNVSSNLRAGEASRNLTFGFVMDGIGELLMWSERYDVSLEYVPDPEYDQFDDVVQKDGNTLTLTGKRIDSAITAQEITVRIGTGTCKVTVINEETLICEPPEEKPSNGDFRGNETEAGYPVVWVIHSNLEFRIGLIRYPGIDVPTIVIPAVSGAILVCILFLVLCFVAQVYGAKREVKFIQRDLQAMEETLADEVKQAFAELQTDMTDLTADLKGIGMPFVSHREYAANMLFIGQDTVPDTEDEEYPDEHVEKAMARFSQLLSNKNFLLILIQTLDAESTGKLSIREKQSIASLLTVMMVLENKLVYMTDIIITLMTRLIEDAADSDRTRQLFCRTETILEKLMSNWVALCLYDQLKNYTAYPLFVLYRAIKYRSENGPIDVITGRSRFSLNYEKLLQEDVEFNEQTLVVLINEDGSVIKEVKVLDVDTISQVKEKILDAIHRNKPYSSRPSANQVSLEWRQGRSGRLVLTDTDLRPGASTDRWRRINMLKDFHVPDYAQVCLVEKQDVPNATLSESVLRFEGRASYVNVTFDDEKIRRRMSTKRRYTIAEVEAEEGISNWHFTKEEDWAPDEEGDGGRKRRGCISLEAVTFRNKVTRRRINEISFPRLLSTKGIVQEYVDNMFRAILSVESAPKAIKYLFDFFDSQAMRHDLTSKDPDIVHVWKSNILPLRFWSNAIKHPDYIFDIRPSRTVEASLDVIGQLFHDAHDTKAHKLGREASINKLLYGREKMKYHALVESFFEEVQELSPVPTQELNKELYKACENFTGLFSKLSTLDQLWKYVRRFKKKLLDVMEDNERCEEEHLDNMLEEVEDILSEVNEDAV